MRGKKKKAFAAGIFLIVMCLGSYLTVAAATYDTVKVKFLYEIRDSKGAVTTQRAASEDVSLIIRSEGHEPVRINAPAKVEGYEFKNVEIKEQKCTPDEGGAFVYAQFVDGLDRILLEYEGVAGSTEFPSHKRDITLKIVCTPKVSRIIYDFNGGTGNVSGKQVVFNEPYGTLATPTRGGYSFIGWSTDIAGTKYVYADSICKASEDHVLYAQWSAKQVTVTYNPAGGRCDTKQAQVSYGGIYPLPKAEKDGYEFSGWYFEADGGAKITEKTTVSQASDHSIYAHWKNRVYTVKFDGNGGRASSLSKEVTYLGTFGTLPEASREGYAFDGWWTDRKEGSLITASSTNTIADVRTLYAHWKANAYEITFDANGGKVPSGKEKMTVVYDKPYGTLPEPEQDGYTFVGWFLDGSEITENSIVEITEGRMLKAEWMANIYEVTFEADPGECEERSIHVTYGQPYGKLPMPNRTGYHFGGWHIGRQKVTQDSIVDLLDDDVLIAKWIPNTYHCTFHANGGKCTAKKWDYTFDDIYGELPKPEREGYQFLGWFTAKDGGREITELMTCDFLSDFDLYARWEKIVVEDEGQDYKYPKDTDTDAYEKTDEKSLKEVAKESGYTVGTLRNIMNLYQVKAEVAADLLTRAKRLGASAKVVLTDPDEIEHKKDGTDLSGSKFLPLKARTDGVTSSSVTIRWNKIKGAKHYIIYGAACGRNYYKLSKATSGRTFTHTKLSEQTYYRYIVVAVAKIDGKSVPIAISKTIHAVTDSKNNGNGKGQEYGNETKISVKNEKTLKKGIKAGRKVKIETEVSYSADKHNTHRGLKFVSSNKKVATVSKNGNISAKKKGKCYITIYAQNGLSKRIKVVVR